MTERDQVIEFLKSQNILTLATVTEDGSLYATPLFYVLHGVFCLYWVSSASSLHSQSLSSVGDAAAAIYAATDEWKEIRGVQMKGRVHEVVEAVERKKVLHHYTGRFHLGSMLRIALSQSTLYRLTPTWVRLLDNSKCFGYKREFRIAEDGTFTAATHLRTPAE